LSQLKETPVSNFPTSTMNMTIHYLQTFASLSQASASVVVAAASCKVPIGAVLKRGRVPMEMGLVRVAGVANETKGVVGDESNVGGSWTRELAANLHFGREVSF
jgi:hypothetical protein